MNKVLEAFARHTVFANILLVMIFFAGFLAVQNLVRELFPVVSMEMVTVRVMWPGADPEEVEEGISRKIEEAIEGIEGIKRYDSTSGEGVSSVVVFVKDGYNVDKVKERVSNAVDGISTIPEAAEKPTVEEFVRRNEVITIALSGEDISEKLLKEWGERIKDELQNKPGITQTKILGARAYEIGIEVSEERLREYGLTFGQVAEAIRASSINLSGGVVRTEGEEIRLRTVGRKYTAAELSEVVLLARSNGEIITLDRVATIQDAFTEDKIIARFNGAPAILLMALKTDKEDTLQIAKTVRQYVEEEQRRLPEGLSLSLWADNSRMLNARIELLVRNGLIGLVLVFFMLWLFLDARLSFWAGMGIPISLSGALALMWVLGQTINMISLFALIMVLGIVVDDAIVVGEAIYVARRRGAGPLAAAVEGVSEVGLPVIAAVLTSIVAFLPLAFVSGIMGKMIYEVPIAVITCLAVSLVECLFLLPAHLNRLPDPASEKKSFVPFFLRPLTSLRLRANAGIEWFVASVYAPFIARALRFRYVALSVAMAVLVVAVGVQESGIVKFTVFPKLDEDLITATIEFPNGTPLAVTQEAVKLLEQGIREVAEAREGETLTGEPLIKNMFSTVGATISDDRPRYANNLGSVRVELLTSEDRGIFSEQIIVDWREAVGAIPGAISLGVASGGPGPSGASVEYWLKGHDMGVLLAAADEMKHHLGTFDGVAEIQTDFQPGKNELSFKLKPEARGLGLTVSDLAQQVYAGYYGEEAARIQRGRDDVRVRVRYTESERSRLSDLDSVRIRTPNGHEVPLYSVADVNYGPGYASIKRTDGMRRVSVTAEVDTSKVKATEIFAKLDQGYITELEEKYSGIIVTREGSMRMLTEPLGSLAFTYPIAMLGVFIIIATIFRSYLQPMIIMMTVPFGIIGAVIGHYFMGFDLSMMSMFGMVALSGVVVNDAIVLIECINKFIEKGTPFFEAIQKGGARRFRAVFLTTVSTCGGLTPLIIEKDLQARFLIPMAISIAAGVAFATLLTLILIPCLLGILNDFRRIGFWLLHRTWPTCEEVEPAHVHQSERYKIPTTPAPVMPSG